MKNTIILFFAFLFFSSCNAKNKANETEAIKVSEKKIEIDKNTLIWAQDEAFPNYSYKNYQIEPFLYGNYKMPIQIGSKWLILYHNMENDRLNLNLKLYTIQDSIYVSSKKGPHILNFSRPNTDSLFIPKIDETLTNPETMFFFKGFNKYNTNLVNDLKNKKISDYNIHEDGGANEAFSIVYFDFKCNSKPFSIEDTYIESNIDVKIEREEEVKEYAHYIVYKNENQSQCLIYRQADSEIFNPLEYLDLDGDGLPDLILNINYNTESKDAKSEIYSTYSSYLLYLSSEAEEGELLKLVATKTIEIKRTVHPLLNK